MNPTPISRADYEKLKKFEEGYKKLCEETGCSVGGCGCCGSPWVQVDGSNGPLIEDMQTNLLDDPACYTIVDGPDPYETIKALRINKVIEVSWHPNIKRLGIGQTIAIPAKGEEARKVCKFCNVCIKG